MPEFTFTRDNPFVGTAKQFASNKIFLNGRALDAISVGALAHHGLLEDAGDGPKPQRGRTPRLYRAFTNNNMHFTRDNTVQMHVEAQPVVAEQNDPAVDSDIAAVVDNTPEA